MGQDVEQMPVFLTKIHHLIGGFGFLFLRKHFKFLNKISFRKFKYSYLIKRNNLSLIKNKFFYFLLSLKAKSKKKYNRFIKKNKFIFFRNNLKILKNKYKLKNKKIINLNNNFVKNNYNVKFLRSFLKKIKVIKKGLYLYTRRKKKIKIFKAFRKLTRITRYVFKKTKKVKILNLIRKKNPKFKPKNY